jgi:hypothetical protein
METSFPVAVSVKIEDGVESDERNGNVSTNEMKSSAGPQMATEAASHSPQNVLPLASSLDESFLIGVPPEKAVLASYPPGCLVLHISTSDTPSLVTFGIVQSVLIDLMSRLFVYRVAPTDTGTGYTFLSPESQLQWSPSCKVWAFVSPNGADQSVWKPCIVLTAYQPSPQSPPLFSLQNDEPSGTGALFHGIPKHCIKYRPVNSESPNGEEPAVGVAPIVVNEGPVPHAPAPGRMPLGRPVVNENFASPASAKIFVPQEPVMNQVPAPRASAEIFVPQGSDMNDKPASRAARRLSLVSNYSTQSRTSETMPTRFTPAATRPSDTEIERPSAKRAKTNQGLPSPMGFAGNNEEGATPVGSVVQFPTSSEEAVNRELSARRRSKTQVTAAEEEYANDEMIEQEDLSTVDFVIPGCVFDDDTIIGTYIIQPHSFLSLADTQSCALFWLSGFVVRNWKMIKRETNCKIDAFSRGKEPGQMRMYLQLTGPREQITTAQRAVERSLVSLVDKDERGRALYYMALANKHRNKSDNTEQQIVFQYCCHLKKPGMKHMLHQKLPKDFEEIIGFVIGKNGGRKRQIEYETKCKIEINVDCDKPHFIIYGDTNAVVRECGWRLKEIVKQGRLCAQKQGRLRR